MSTPTEHAAVISDRQRLWEVRKYCQVRAVLGYNDGDDGDSAKEPRAAAEPSRSDPALSSLLRLLMSGLDADVAMVSLLDEETQFFLAGARKGSDELTVQFTEWFGCNQVLHFGGLCERTIAVDSTQPPAIYEELDMSKIQRLKNVPYVNGDLAKYRYYAGAPVKTAEGIPIGTVFVMSHKPSSGLNADKQQLLIDTASHVMRQLSLTLQALEGERLMQFQSATGALLLKRQKNSLYQQGKRLTRKQSGLNQQPEYILEVYQHAAEVMRRSLELDGVLFQHVPSESHPQTTSENSKDSTLATSLNAESSRPICLSRLEVEKIITMFPQGAVLHQLDGDWLTSTLDEGRPSLDSDIKNALQKSFEGAQQLLIMPLFDVIHDRTAAICVGWLNDYSRVYSDRCDLPFVSAFCMSTMSEGLRLETQMLERIKSDFLGSISHEMKTPLHQILGNLELLLQTDCSDEQCDLVVNARFGGTQLLETINKILQYSHISSESDTKPEDTPATKRVSDEKEVLQIIGPRVEHVAGAASSVDLVRMCEEVVEDTTKRMRLLETIMTPSEEEGHEPEDSEQDGEQARSVDGSERHPFTIVVFDASPIDRVQIPRNTGFRIVLENLLV
jgi:signal transduction histidine kinase